MIAKGDRVGQILEAEGVLGEPRDRERSRNRAERDDEVAIGHVDQRFLGLDVDTPALRIVRDRPAEDEVGVRAHDP